MVRTLFASCVLAASGELFLPRLSVDCPGGSLSACIGLCASPFASVRDACARACTQSCASPSPTPPVPEPIPVPEPTPGPAPAPVPPAPHTDVWFGEGCFWERQYAYTLVELNPEGPFRRSSASVSTVTGYAGSLATANGQVCYDTPREGTDDYGSLGHAEQVRVSLDAGLEEAQFSALVDNFFASFNATEQGFFRPDPEDKGSPYRTIVGIPGGVNGKLFRVLEAANVPRGPYKLTMTLQADGVGSQSDAFNTVFIMDTSVFPFYQAEQYHQFHSDIRDPAGNFTYYPNWYRHDLWQIQIDLGNIPFGGSTACPDNRLKHY